MTAHWRQTRMLLGIFDADGYRPFRSPIGQDGFLYYAELDHVIPLGDGHFTWKLGGYVNAVSGNYLTQYTTIGAAGAQSGLYGIAEYRWQGKGADWGLFMQAAGTPASAASVATYFGTGLRVRHFLRRSEGTTLSIGMARVSQRSSGSETLLEMNLRQPLFDHVFLSPDIQYVINPGANAASYAIPDAWVGMLRIGWRGRI
ncbi:carbohydrate porin [Acidithiobacillus sp. IBUN Pt1247-S3]